MDQRGRPADDGAGVVLDERQAHHARDERRAVDCLGMAVDVAILTRQLGREIGPPGSEQPVNLGAELRSNGPPGMVIPGMPGVGRSDAAFNVQPSLSARSPGAAAVGQPLLAKLLNRQARPMLLEGTQRAHFVIPVVVDDRVRVRLRVVRQPLDRSGLMFEWKTEIDRRHLCHPGRVGAVGIVGTREPECIGAADDRAAQQADSEHLWQAQPHTANRAQIPPHGKTLLTSDGSLVSRRTARRQTMHHTASPECSMAPGHDPIPDILRPMRA